MAKVFRTQFTLRFRDADPAQIMFFGNLFGIAHDAYEEFIVAAGYQWKEWFRKGEVVIPIRHAESDFLKPFRPGETYEIEVNLSQMRETSFQSQYRFKKDGHLHARVTLVHAVLDSNTMQKTAIPAEMRRRLEPYLEEPIP